MKKVILFICVLALENLALAKAPISIKDISDVQTITRRTDGDFDVFCKDGTHEIHDEYDVTHNQMCMFEEESGKWEQITGATTGGTKFCDIATEKVSKNGNFISFQAYFMAPCDETVSTASTCTANSCDVTIDQIDFRIDFINDYEIDVTRKADNFKGRFQAL